MSEVVTVTGKLSLPHGGRVRGNRVRLVVDGVIDADGGKDTAHGGTEFKLGIRGEAAHWLTGNEASRFDDAIAEAKAAAGDEDERQGQLGEDE